MLPQKSPRFSSFSRETGQKSSEKCLVVETTLRTIIANQKIQQFEFQEYMENSCFSGYFQGTGRKLQSSRSFPGVVSTMNRHHSQYIL